jgi:type I restriction enzyme S subunit
MSELDTLLQGVEVEWKTLGKALVRTKGTNITAGQMKVLHKDGAPLKIFAGGKTTAFFNYDDIPLKDINREPSIIVKSRGVIEFEYYDKPFSHKNEMWSYHSKDENLDIKFVYYFLKIQEPYFRNIAGKMQMPQIATPDTDKFLIPIPPLPVQKEIVRILDKFTELTAELTARKKQYIFYREQFFEFDDVEIKREPLGIIGEFQRGKRFVKDDMLSEGVPCIHYGEMYTYYGTWANKSKSFLSEELVERKNLRIAENGDVVIVAAGETIEDIGLGTAWLGNEGVVIHDACFSFRSPLNPKYVAYFTRTKQFHDQIKKHISSGKISAINARGLEKVLIPVPSPEEQARIVSILDTFDTLTTSISEGLPKEIELRKKQYEYYRDKLLTFPKENTEI